MNLKEIEMNVERLRKADLIKFIEWFDGFREATVLEGDGDTAKAQQEEVIRRKAEYLANPSWLLLGTMVFSIGCGKRLVDALL